MILAITYNALFPSTCYSWHIRCVEYYVFVIPELGPLTTTELKSYSQTTNDHISKRASVNYLILQKLHEFFPKNNQHGFILRSSRNVRCFPMCVISKSFVSVVE